MKGFLDWLVALGDRGLLVASILDGAGLPIPGGVDALVVFLASRHIYGVAWLTTVAVVGSTAGNMMFFLLARRGGEMYLAKRSRSRRSIRFRNWFDHYGLLTVFISALVPLPIMPMKIFVLCAGALGSTTKSFLSAFVTARVARYFGLAYLGNNMGANAIGFLSEHAWHLLAFSVLLFAFLYGLVKIAGRRRIAA